jgi:long-chain fatty acid transport protein
MKRMKLLLSAFAMAAFLGSSVFANGLSLNSVGTRALGMGGAFVGLANDGTALYWNPAGLAGQQSRLYLFATDVIPAGTYKMDAAGINASTKTNHYLSPNFMVNYNLGKLAVAFGVYVPAGLGAEWTGSDLKNLTAPFGPYEWMSKLAVINFSPAIAYQVTDKFSVGLAVNIYYGMFDLKKPYDTPMDITGDGVPDVLPQYSESSTGLGYGATFGLKYDVSEKLSLGASFRTSTAVSMDGTAELGTVNMKDDFTRDVTWPMWIAGGLAFHPKKNMTVTVDAQYSNWAALDKMVAKYKTWGEGEFILNWKNAIQYRVGFENALSKSFVYRVGYYYDPAPAPDATLNILFPSSTNNAVTGGFSYMMGKFQIDAAAEYLFGAERTVEAAPGNGMPGKHQLNVMSISLGFGYNL